MSMPALDSVIAKSEAMSESSPMGMNSDVLNMNVENVRLMTGSHLLKLLFSFAIYLYLSYNCRKNRAKLILYINVAICETIRVCEIEFLKQFLWEYIAVRRFVFKKKS